jgi:hypothetical protein
MEKADGRGDEQERNPITYDRQAFSLVSTHIQATNDINEIMSVNNIWAWRFE